MWGKKRAEEPAMRKQYPVAPTKVQLRNWVCPKLARLDRPCPKMVMMLLTVWRASWEPPRWRGHASGETPSRDRLEKGEGRVEAQRARAVTQKNLNQNGYGTHP